jgi:hypothetical protein
MDKMLSPQKFDGQTFYIGDTVNRKDRPDIVGVIKFFIVRYPHNIEIVHAGVLFEDISEPFKLIALSNLELFYFTDLGNI